MFVLKSKYFDMVSRLNNEIRVLKLKLNDEKEKISRIITISQDHFFENDNSTLIFFKDHKDALYFCRHWIKDDKITIKINKLETSLKINLTNRHAAVLDAQIIENSIIEIYDIQMMENFINRGIGSFLIKVLKNISQQKNIKTITGDLSSVDLEEHGERLRHFYRKNGFLIKKNPSPEGCKQYLIKYIVPHESISASCVI